MSHVPHELHAEFPDEAERLMAEVEAGCHSPIGALGRQTGTTLTLLGVLADPDGQRLIQMSVEGSATDPEGVGRNLGAKMLRAGGEEILAALRPGASE